MHEVSVPRRRAGVAAAALALGVVAAVASSPGIAAAEPSDSGSSVTSADSTKSDAVDTSAPRLTDLTRLPSQSIRRSLGVLQTAVRATLDDPRQADRPARVDSRQRSSRLRGAATTTAAAVPAAAAEVPTKAPRVLDAVARVLAPPTVVDTPGLPATVPAPRQDVVRAVPLALRAVGTNVFTAVLAPLAGSGPATPRAPSPMMWTLAAAARGEFGRRHTSSTGASTVASTSQPAATTGDYETRTLVLTAFPAELDAVLARTELDPDPVVLADGRQFYLGTMGGKKVVVAMTGIGMVNATDTTAAAFTHFTPESGTNIGAVVFSGVAGGADDTRIADVAVPGRWTLDDGTTWHSVDPGMLSAAKTLDVDLGSVNYLGNPLCQNCIPLPSIPLIDLRREPRLVVGGDGSSGDGNNGQAFPCIPFGGDIFGCQSCSAPGTSPLYTGNFFTAVVPFLADGLLSNIAGFSPAENPELDAVDQETAAAQAVADAHGVPFLGIRGMSDGPGDPLNLPGFPFQFAFYKQIAADNAAIVTEAFLQEWAGPAD